MYPISSMRISHCSASVSLVTMLVSFLQCCQQRVILRVIQADTTTIVGMVNVPDKLPEAQSWVRFPQLKQPFHDLLFLRGVLSAAQDYFAPSHDLPHSH